MLTFVRAIDQDERVYELVSDGDDPLLPTVGDIVNHPSARLTVKGREFDYQETEVLRVLLHVVRHDENVN